MSWHQSFMRLVLSAWPPKSSNSSSKCKHKFRRFLRPPPTASLGRPRPQCVVRLRSPGFASPFGSLTWSATSASGRASKHFRCSHRIRSRRSPLRTEPRTPRGAPPGFVWRVLERSDPQQTELSQEGRVPPCQRPARQSQTLESQHRRSP